MIQACFFSLVSALCLAAITHLVAELPQRPSERSAGVQRTSLRHGTHTEAHLQVLFTWPVAPCVFWVCELRTTESILVYSFEVQNCSVPCCVSTTTG